LKGFNRVTKKAFMLTTLALAILISSMPIMVMAQTSRPSPNADMLKFLPGSDAIVIADVGRLLNEVLPGVVAGDAAKLAQINDGIAKLKARTGIDPRTFDRVMVGLRYTYPSPSVTKVENVTIAHGRFEATALSAASREAAGAKYREEKYRGLTISIINVNDRIKVPGLGEVRVNDLAFCVLDANTLALGDPVNVRAAIDAGRTGVPANRDLAALASRDANALVGFAGRVTRALLDNLHVDTVSKDIASIREVYGSISTTQTDLTLMLVARTGTAAEAKGVSDALEGFKQLGAIFVSRMQPPKKTVAQHALDSLTVTIAGNEVQIKTQLAWTDVNTIIR
jgi:hypothetical protein